MSWLILALAAPVSLAGCVGCDSLLGGSAGCSYYSGIEATANVSGSWNFTALDLALVPFGGVRHFDNRLDVHSEALQADLSIEVLNATRGTGWLRVLLDTDGKVDWLSNDAIDDRISEDWLSLEPKYLQFVQAIEGAGLSVMPDPDLTCNCANA